MRKRSILASASAALVCVAAVIPAAAHQSDDTREQAGSVIAAAGNDQLGDVRISGLRGEGTPSLKTRRSIDLDRVVIRDTGMHRVIKVRVKRVLTRRSSGLKQSFSVTSKSASGEVMAAVGFESYRGLSGVSFTPSAYCPARQVRVTATRNTVTVKVPARCLPVQWGGRVQVDAMVVKPDYSAFSRDRLKFRARSGW